MRVLGIDPGLVRMGFGIVESVNNSYKFVHYDVLRMSSKETICERIDRINSKVRSVIEEHNIDVVAIEDIFVSVNPRSALKLGQARGAAIASALACGVGVFEYTPNEIKKSVSNFGKAQKSQVTRMVEVLLGIRDIKPHDAADALAVSICHINSIPFRERTISL